MRKTLMKSIHWLWNKKWLILFWGVFLFAVGHIAYWAIYPNQSPYWTGFGEYKASNGEVVPSKNLWDWLNLLIVPFVLAIGAWWLNKTEKQNEQELAEKRAEFDRKLEDDRNREAILQSYLDHMTNLLLANGLRESKKDDEIRSIARAKTITVLRILDSIRKGILLQFLREAGLIEEDPIVNIKWANLSRADLQKANLVNASLRNVNLNEAQLSGAYLFQANLSGASFHKATLYKAKVISANLKLAKMDEANLTEADFTETNLSIANLNKVNAKNAHFEKANLRSADLSEANLQNANLTDADLSMAKLVNADLSNAVLTRANLRGANLTNANLIGTTLDDTDLSLTNLAGVKISSEQIAKAKSISMATLPSKKD